MDLGADLGTHWPATDGVSRTPWLILFFRSLESAMALADSNSVEDMIPHIIKLYTLNISLYKNVNFVLRRFPFRLISIFGSTLQGLLSYTCILQASIAHLAKAHPISEDTIVYRGIDHNGQQLLPLYYSMLDEVIVYPSFTSSTLNREYALTNFVGDNDGILFEIVLHPGTVAADIHELSAIPVEQEVLIAASTAFRIDRIEECHIPRDGFDHELVIPMVCLSSHSQWHEFDFEKWKELLEPPPEEEKEIPFREVQMPLNIKDAVASLVLQKSHQSFGL
jgi:hypothetical protein